MLSSCVCEKKERIYKSQYPTDKTGHYTRSKKNVLKKTIFFSMKLEPHNQFIMALPVDMICLGKYWKLNTKKKES